MNSLNLLIVILFLSIDLYSVQNQYIDEVNPDGTGDSVIQSTTELVTTESSAETESTQTNEDPNDTTTTTLASTSVEDYSGSNETDKSFTTPTNGTEGNETTTEPTPITEPTTLKPFSLPNFDPPNYKYKVLKYYSEDYVTPSVFLLIGLILIILTIAFHYYMDSKEKQRQIATGTRYKPDRKRREDSAKSPTLPSDSGEKKSPPNLAKTTTVPK